jgi:large subunit ribosomal protein L10
MTVVKNSLAKRAVGDGSKLKGFDKTARRTQRRDLRTRRAYRRSRELLLDEKKADEKIELRGIFFDGEVYVGEKGVQQVSKLPTREEAIGQSVALVLSPGRNLAGALKGPGGKLGCDRQDD